MVSTVDIFRRVFASAGYKEQVASPIFPSPDATTLFTCATISVLKKHLLTGEPEKDFVIQPCLRTQNLKRLLDKNFDPEYLSNFLMLGTLCPADGFAFSHVSDFFSSFPELEGRILVRSSMELREPLFSSASERYPTEYDTREQRYYVWHYGESSLSGRGLTFAIKQPAGTFLDIGNLVLIHKCEVPSAVEFGFGLETFTARLHGKGSPFAASQDHLRLGLGLLPAEKRLGDSLITAVSLFRCNVVPGAGKASSVLRKALRTTCFAAIRDYGELAADRLRELARRASPDTSWLDLVERIYGEVRIMVDAFNHEMAHIKRSASGPYLEKKIKEYQLRYGIPEQFVQ